MTKSHLARKTFEVSPVLESVNLFLKVAEDSADRRQGHIDVITGVLFGAGNYGGYRYLRVEEVPPGQLPGIWGEPPPINNPNAECYVNTDSTRVQFYLKGGQR